MQLFIVLVLALIFPFSFTVASTLTGLPFKVHEEVEKFFYEGPIMPFVCENENLFPLTTYTEELKKVLQEHSDKTRSELFGVSFQLFEDFLMNIGEFNSLDGTKAYNLFQDFIIRNSSASKSDDFYADNFEPVLNISSFDFNDFDTLAKFSFDNHSVVADCGDEGSIISDDENPSPSRPLGRTDESELDAKKWTLAAEKLSRFPLYLYSFVLTLPDTSLAPIFFESTKICDNLKESFNQEAQSKHPFNEQIIMNYFSVQVLKFVQSLTIGDENVVDSFVASVMKIGQEIYNEIRNELGDVEVNSLDSFEPECKRMRPIDTHLSPAESKRMRPIETSLSPAESKQMRPIDTSLSPVIPEGFASLPTPVFFDTKAQQSLFQNMASDFRVEEDNFDIPPGAKETEEGEDNEGFIDIATLEELAQPVTVNFLNSPFQILQEVVIANNVQEFDRIRSIYYGLVEHSFPEMGEAGKGILGGVLDYALNKVFKGK